MLAMPERAKVFAQSRRATAMPTFARLFTRETPRRCVQKRLNELNLVQVQQRDEICSQLDDYRSLLIREKIRGKCY